MGKQNEKVNLNILSKDSDKHRQIIINMLKCKCCLYNASFNISNAEKYLNQWNG